MSTAERIAEGLGVSQGAVELAWDADLIDLHLDTFIPPRLWGYDIFKRHGLGVFRGHFFGHLDVPRLQDGGLSGAMWSITTNPFRTAKSRWRQFQGNLKHLEGLVDGSGGTLSFAKSLREYRAVIASGAHAVLLAVQGANALQAAPDGIVSAGPLLTRVTLVHLTNAIYGATSSPFSSLRRDKGLTDAGRALIGQLNSQRVFVDLAHIHPTAFWQAVEAHDASQPLLVTHTGVQAARRSWRNLEDEQLRAVADTGGVVGVMYAEQFLKRRGGPRSGAMVVEHLEHIAKVAGEDCMAIGTDYDGAITPPVDLRSGDSYPRLIQHMLDRGWAETRIRKTLGGNFLRAFGALRPY